jgi:glycosyltransferase involved in cell wall biosynthesis
MTQLNLPSDKIDVVYNGCRTFFSPMSATEQALVKNQYSAGEDYFVYIGAIHPRKNVHRLIAAFDTYKQRSNSKTKLLLGGRFAWQVGAVKDAFDQAKHKDDILFLGYLNTTELHQIIASALAMVYVSTFEGFGVPLLEAMHCDVPTITSTTSSMPEVVGDAGICIAPEDVTGIADAMFRVEQDLDLRTTLIERGRLQRQKFSWDISANQIWAEILKLKK